MDHAVDGTGDERAWVLFEAVFFLLEHVLEVVPSVHQLAKLLLVFWRRLQRGELGGIGFTGKIEDDSGIEGIGLCQQTFTFGEVADPTGVDTDDGAIQLPAACNEGFLIAATSFADNLEMGSLLLKAPQPGENGRLGIIDLCSPMNGVEDLEDIFGHIDCDVDKALGFVILRLTIRVLRGTFHGSDSFNGSSYDESAAVSQAVTRIQRSQSLSGAGSTPRREASPLGVPSGRVPIRATQANHIERALAIIL
jgi:hypothetical protein